MNTSLEEKHKKALLASLYQRIKNQIQFLTKKKCLIISGLIKKVDADKLQKIREDILK